MKAFGSVSAAILHSLNNNGETAELLGIYLTEEDKRILEVLADNEEENDAKMVLGALEPTVEIIRAGTVRSAPFWTRYGDLVSGNKWKVRYFQIQKK